MADDAPRIGKYRMCAKCAMSGFGHAGFCPYAVHWVGAAPTSLHGNGASSFKRTTRDPAEASCSLCITLIRRGDHLRAGHGSTGSGSAHG
ncbi:MAG: hypothetical protein K0S37_2394 [Microbacterium sp.]|nr:hypothetical protein [Microbacterium sp.]